MPRYRVLRKSYMPRIPGDVAMLIDPEKDDPFVIYEGKAGDNLQLVDQQGNPLEADLTRVAAEQRRGPPRVILAAPVVEPEPEAEEVEAAPAPRPVAPPVPPRRAPPPPKRGPGRPPKR